MQASAYVVGHLDKTGADLTGFARRLGFAHVAPYAGIAQAEAQSGMTPICFFLFAAVPDVAVLHGVADAIRFCPNRHVRFAPLIYFAPALSADTIKRCIDMSFDDVISLPLAAERVRERLNRQIGQSLTYYETSGYFGPDRRGRVTAPSRPAESRRGGQFRRLEIVRSLTAGVTVVRDDLHMLPG